ncbi:hypothetical protein H2198_008247 [Neophaeococcomyces mojaviensis]|uniref:Uncharacterized protein n=1 Tax=Neophaeococcomyces mojaviensis TaxID=3383035 RepID=A0ACC2ZYF4_9EURO|nr:hypothetical protein H2198_008247 [Knufia sp. JES_112]
MDRCSCESQRHTCECSEHSNQRRRHSDVTQYQQSPTGISFQYKPLDRSKGAIRLVRVFPLHDGNTIQCQIIRAQILTTEYVAISYVWGSDNGQRTISLNGQQLTVRPNLFSFLRHAAEHRFDSLFWIDAICINQSDVEEKNGHVRHMGAIYANATKVIAWLADKSSVPSLAMCREPPRQWLCCDQHDRPRPTTRHYLQCDWKVPASLSWELVRHEYWSRLWIAQELGLAKRVDILWKGRFYSWSRLKCHLGHHIYRKGTPKRQSEARSKAFMRNLNYIAKLPIARYLKFVGSGPLGNLVPQFANHKCQIGHDHVFGLLSMARDGNSFEPDYRESCVSLLFRIMTFCYSNPVAAFTRKLGSALGLEPQAKGIPVEIIGHPKLDTGPYDVSHLCYQLADYDCQVEETDVIVRLPDTYLNFLFRPLRKNEDATHVSLRLVSRVNMVSKLVEKSVGRFGSGRPGQWKRDPEVVFEGATESMRKAVLTIELETKEARFFGDWQTVLSIFEISETQGAQGRLESRIRKWIQNPQLSHDKPMDFHSLALDTHSFIMR